MNNNAWFKKENPLLSLQSMSGGAAGSLMQGAADKTYVDEVFSTFLYKGNSATRQIATGLDMSGEGGMTWIKARDNGQPWVVGGTGLGDNSLLCTNNNSGKDTGQIQKFKSLTSTGFEVGNDWEVNNNTLNYTSFSFRKAPGFFDIVNYTGTGASVLTLSHNLGCVPGMILIKRLDGASSDWIVYHHSTGKTKYLELNTTDAAADDTGDYIWNDTAPTATHFTIGAGHDSVNYNTNNYIAYLFAGVDVASGTSANIDITSKTVTNLGGNFDGSYPMSKLTDGILETSNATNMAYVNASANPSNPDMDVYVDLDTPHVVTKYRIGPQGGNGTSGYNLVNNFTVHGTNDTSSWNFVAAFEPGQSGWTGGAYRDFEWGAKKSYRYWRIQVTQGDSGNNKSISEWKIEGYSATLDTSSYIFGVDGDKNIVDCGSYIGNGSATGPEIPLDWEPSLIILKNAEKSENWLIWDSMRGIVTGGYDARLFPNLSTAESSIENFLNLTPTGFQINDNGGDLNEPNDKIIYMAIRRPDGYVGKPAEAGTDVFAMDVGNDSSAVPMFDSGFPVDFGMFRMPGDASSWWTGARLTQGKRLKTNSNDTESSSVDHVFDSNEGWYGPNNLNSSWQSWMWKRGQGFDVVTYSGNGVNDRKIPHSLNKTVEMIWLKVRDHDDNWIIGHKGLDGGTNPWEHNLYFDSNSETDYTFWNDTAPTSTHFTIGSDSYVNHSSRTFIAMLFASVNGISKVGSFDGSSSDVTITTGFTPRFIIIRSYSHNQNWCVFDTLRSLGSSGNDQLIKLNASAAQSAANTDYVNTTATGFVAKSGQSAETNGGSTYKYIYYAHA